MKTFYQISSVNGIADVDSDNMNDNNVYWIRRINISRKHRGKGYGSKLLDMICADADREQVILMLFVVSTGELDNSQLRKWYESRGFICNTDIYTLYRLPKPLPTQNFSEISEKGCKKTDNHGILSCESVSEEQSQRKTQESGFHRMKP